MSDTFDHQLDAMDRYCNNGEYSEEREFKYIPDETVNLEFTKIIHNTEKASLFLIEGKEIWLPKSKTKVITDKWLEIPLWLAEKIKEEHFNK